MHSTNKESKQIEKAKLINKMNFTSMKKLILGLLFIIPILFAGNQVKASHFSGADVSYTCLGGDTFLITVNAFRDCSGIGIGTAVPQPGGGFSGAGNFNITSPCGTVTPTFTAVHTNSGLPFGDGGLEVSQLCNASLPNSRCNTNVAGFLPGMVQYIFEAVVVLPPCNFWTMNYTVPCCRNTSQTLVGQPAGPSVVSVLNNLDAPCNSSPQFEAQPIPYVCAGQNVAYNFGASEPDGDSLVFSLVTPLTNGPGNPVPFTPPWTATNPIASLTPVTLNPNTGELTFIPTTVGNWVVAVQVDEYRNGVLVGSIVRDIQIVVQICANTQPLQIGGITNFTGTGQQMGPNEVEVCVGDVFTFDIPFSDVDSGDSLEFETNIQTILPGATFNVTYPNAPFSYDSAVVQVSWQASLLAGNFYSFFVKASDGACPVPGFVYSTYSVTIITSTFAGNDQTICQGTQSATLQAVGGTAFEWFSISGDPLVVGPNGNISCDTCAQAVVSPFNSTCYRVQSNLSSTCKSDDTVCVFVAPNFELTMSPDTLICSANELEIFVNTDQPTFNYDYQWNNSKFLNNATISNPKALPDRPTTFTVTVSAGGCVKEGNTTIDISNPFPQNIKLTASDTLICESGSVQFDIDLGTIQESQCEPAFRPCIGNTTSYPVGFGTQVTAPGTGPAGFPNFFNRARPSAKQQFLYRASDLLASGMTAGQISGLTIEVINLGNSPIYNDYTVRMGCTSKNALGSTYEGGLSTVKAPHILAITTGFNAITFDNPYIWDGQSNIIIEVCYFNSGTATGTNAVIAYTNVAYAASSYSQNNIALTSQCNSFQSTQQQNRLPNIQFQLCTGVNPGGFNFSWTANGPSGFTTPANIQNPLANVNLTTADLYSVVITDTFGVCSDTQNIRINVVDEYDVKPIVDDICVNGAQTFLKANTPYDILPRPNGGYWSGVGIVNDSLGLWDPSVSGLGQFWVVYEVIGDNCANKDSSLVDVIPAPDASITSLGPVCAADTAYLLSGVLTGGTWSSSQFPNSVDETGILDASLVGGNSVRVIHRVEVGGCVERDTAVIQINPAFNAGIQPIPSLCPDAVAITLQGIAPGGTWSGLGITDPVAGTFDPSLVGAGNQTTISLDSAGVCGGSATLIININDIPDINFGYHDGDPLSTPVIPGEPEPLCGSDDNVITVIPNPAPNGTWTHINNWTNQGQPAYVPNRLNPGTYQSIYTLTDMNGCVNRDTVDIVILATPDAPKVYDDTICVGEEARLRAELDSSTFNIEWYGTKDLTESIATGEQFSLPGLNEDTIMYAVQVGGNTCKSKASPLKISIFQAVAPAFTPSILNGPEPLDVSFLNESNTFGTDATYTWTYFHSGTEVENTSDETNPTYTFVYNKEFDTGTYTIVLETVNEFGCVSTTSVEIVIDAVAELIIPNVFTPPAKGATGDGFNDAFAPVVSGLRSFEGYIYNRWGRKVGEMTLLNPTWDGVDFQNGEIMPDGVYFYVIKGEGFNGVLYDESGSVTLIRQL